MAAGKFTISHYKQFGGRVTPSSKTGDVSGTSQVLWHDRSVPSVFFIFPLSVLFSFFLGLWLSFSIFPLSSVCLKFIAVFIA